MKVLVAGCGWLGSAITRALVARGDSVTAVRRDPDRAAALRALGATPLSLDLAAAGAAARLPRDVDAVLACQAAAGEGAEAYRRAYVTASAALLELAAARALPLVYTGSTAVFGQRDGSEVDEETPVAPATPAAEVLVEAEALLASAARSGVPARTVRLSGLYGPGRTGLVERVRSGAMGLGPGDGAWMNWCHRDDAVGVVLAALERGRPGAVYHGTDAVPMTRREVVTWIAERLGISPARLADAGPPRGGANRRVRGERTRVELGYRLVHPSLREGLAQVLGAIG